MCEIVSIHFDATILSSPIEYLKGMGPLRADLLKKELSVFTYKDLLDHFPLRHIDKTRVDPIRVATSANDYVQTAGVLVQLQVLGEGRSKRLIGTLRDDTGELDLIWFQAIHWIQKNLETGQSYLVFGKMGQFNGRAQISHPEIELYSREKAGGRSTLEPIYPSTEKLKAKSLGGRQLAKFTGQLLQALQPADLPENLPEKLVATFGFPSRFEAYRQIHFPANEAAWRQAVERLKFEELFLAQLRLSLIRLERHRYSKGVVFGQVGNLFHEFYEQHLPFALTGAQKRVLKEIRADMGQGRQMNRLLQGDVGSGKTMVALLTMLLAADNGFQSLLMAPTEILAAQHYSGISELVKKMPLKIALLTGSTRAAERKMILAGLADGSIHWVIGTHALLEDKVVFYQLGLAIVDEQHRFGVAQRARLWKKAVVPPHILVMTATPIPRTLAMTAYGDLDYSIIDELPPGRQPISTVHRYEHARASVMDFVRAEIAKGRQAYFIFPLIEESDKLDLENLMRGYENIKAFFPEPRFWISVVHGRQAADVKETNMQRFVQNDTHIMVATTVIEVGVNVPNASVMVIESAEKFGLSQLHQLRGRVGRGAEKSFCILLTGMQVNNDARERLKTMCATNDGFLIAEKDLELRGPGDIEGTRQSGELNFRLADLVSDRQLLEQAKRMAGALVESDPELRDPAHTALRAFLQSQKGKLAWSKIS
ncbi:ATP-dependent DNA helicase RecG [Flavihumibacter petaseus]|uniref:ATP-dependent DNA helicase RecG n=1 Tax=Flavihumibacter petaseus NBRC 106054 TaxID=1220578 RepID=A0A0E9MUS1_9BACT|nr:ATP-dependent DNA helicase RecG [Flavihumibacter petaseus]GAO41329.1 ATP-dependent DNA helicase RecG [Flavihumibacter petaseus NBRC 106054]